MTNNWRFWIFVVFGTFLLTSLLGCEGGDGIDNGSITNNESSTADDDEEGNGAPQGPHYTLNIIGSKLEKLPDLNNVGRRIFPPLNGEAKVILTEGAFRMIDGNATDGPAHFQLPNPDPEKDGISNYTAWARTMATPTGTSTTTTCATSAATGEEFCSSNSLTLSRTAGRPLFSDVSEQLLYLFADLDNDGTIEQYPLFDEAFVDYYWRYENEDLKHAQLRFYGEGADGDDDDDDGDDDDGDDDDDDDDTDTEDTDIVV